MTLPDERTRAVLSAYSFFCDLLDPKKTPRVPKEIRQRARRILKHHPFWFDFALGPEQFGWDAYVVPRRDRLANKDLA